ncbi:hypothetical protein [Frankia sp. EAN1pec]|uniref:hypothetical protein n=1 Tax=Parafrankia sp. (strain EAN1pec) TaxID=298653 RepID=UPI0012F8DCA3
MDLRRLAGRRPTSGPDAESSAPAVPEQQTGGRTFDADPGIPPDSPPTTGFVRPATGRGAEPATRQRQDRPDPGTAVPGTADPGRPAEPGRPDDPGRSADPAWTPDAAPHRTSDTTGRGQPSAGERAATDRQRPAEPRPAAPSPGPAADSGPAVDPVEDLGNRAGQTRREHRTAAAPMAVRSRRDMALLALGGAVAAVAAFLPWSTLTSGDETRTFTGITVGDGRLTLVTGLVMALIGLASLRGRGRRAGGAGPAGPAADLLVARASALLLVLVSGFDLALGPPSLSSFRAISADVIAVRPQIGVVVTLVAGLVALAAVARPRSGR